MELPNHLTAEDVQRYAREADNLFEFCQRARVGRGLARRVLSEADLRDEVDTADAAKF